MNSHTNYFYVPQSIVDVIEGHNPAGTSVNALAQLAQGYNSGNPTLITDVLI